MLSNSFHKQMRAENLGIPKDRSQWPQEWKTVSFKSYPRFPHHDLTTNLSSLGDLETALQERTSTREFNETDSVLERELSTLLFYSVGINDTLRAHAHTSQEARDKTRRFYPSGGGRYPLEMYVAIQRVSGIRPGVYHYNVLSHSMEMLLDNSGCTKITDAIRFPWACTAPVFFIITAVQERNATKYRDFGYDMLATEAGHASQNLHLVATSLGKKYCPLFGFDNAAIHTILDLDEDELVLYMTVLG